MISRQHLKVLVFTVVLMAVCAFALSCSGSKAQSNTQNANAQGATGAPPVVEVAVTPAISRQLPRFLEATGSLVAY